MTYGNRAEIMSVVNDFAVIISTLQMAKDFYCMHLYGHSCK